jgi:hypothetical protein
VGSGAQSIANTVLTLSTGVTPNSSESVQTNVRAVFLPGASNNFTATISVGNTGVVNNVRRWGSYDANNGLR